VRRDVEQARRAAPTALPTQAYTEVPHTRLRKLVAARLTESKTTAPHFYLRATVQVDRLLALRAEINEATETRVSVNDLVVKAVGRGPRPGAVAQRHLDRGRGARLLVGRRRGRVATDHGLVTPVVRSVQDLSVTAVSRTMRDLAERARAGPAAAARARGRVDQRHELGDVRHRGVRRDHQPAAGVGPRGRRGAAGAGRSSTGNCRLRR
jgi:pyruvate dehydrogenase E2 component (dihydrolipoamide acetyltransferase)